MFPVSPSDNVAQGDKLVSDRGWEDGFQQQTILYNKQYYTTNNIICTQK
jgi:hypothetical protein